MELTVFPHPDDTVYALPWISYRKEGPCYLADSERVEDYLPYLSGTAHLRVVRDQALWDLMVQDCIKEILSILLLEGFYEEMALPRAMEELGKLLSVFPGHTLSRALESEMKNHGGSLLAAAAGTVAKWHEVREGRHAEIRWENVKTQTSLDDCWKTYPSFIGSALKRLTDILRDSSSLFYGAYVHGSLATLDFVPGSSDLDLVYILHHETARDPAQILEIRRILKETLSCFYAVDRFQHHGPYVLTPQMTSHYLECYLPLAAWRSARPLLGPQSLSFGICASPYHRKLWFRRSVQHYRRHACEGKGLRTIHEAKLLVSMATLLPALAHTFVTGRYIGKAEALKWLTDNFSSERVLQWIHQLTRIREDRLCRSPSTEAEIRIQPDRLSPIPRELSDALSPFPFFRIAQICDWVLGLDVKEGSTAPYLRYVNFPKTAGHDSYEQLTWRFTQFMASLPDVTRIFLSGTLGTPGISDLDFVVVTEDVLQPDTVREIGSLHHRLSVEERALMMHPPMGILPESLLADLPMIFPVKTHRTLVGREPVFHSLTEDEIPLLMLVQLTDFAVAMNGRLFQEMNRRRKVDARLLLNEMGGLKHTAAMLEEAGGEVDGFKSFLASVDRLRNHWFEAPHLNDLPDFLRQGVLFIESVNRQVVTLWQRQGFLCPKPCSYRAPSTGADFEPSVCETRWHTEGTEIVIHLPELFAIPLMHYATLEGRLSHFLRQHMTGQGMKQGGRIGEILTQRGSVLNAHFEFLLRNQFRGGFFAPFHFGWNIGRERLFRTQERKPLSERTGLEISETNSISPRIDFTSQGHRDL